MLQRFGFGLTWRLWFKACLESSRTSILVNGSPTFEFSVKRGLRQGDMLSPFLFILVMEGLHIPLSEATRTSLVRGVKMGPSHIIISHIFYADDVVINTDWSSNDMDNIIRAFLKRKLVPWLIISGVAPGSFPFTYLGLPIGSNMNHSSNWKILIDRLQSRLSKWKANLLSIGGHLTLIKSVLGSRDICYLSFFKPPDFVLKALESIRALFFGVILKAHDLWIGDSPLYLRYNILFRIEQDKDCLIIDRIYNNQWSWNWSRSDLGNRNEAYLDDLINEISQVVISSNSDACYWSIANDGVFTVGITHKHLDDHFLPSSATLTCWDKTLPRKVNIFL
nr:RNA-directed DNA polymerase, eukaryota [Tanacetum cinerariifolium]